MPTLPANGAQLFDTAVFNAQVPKEGPKACGLTVPWDGVATSFDVNMLLTQSQQFMSMIQAIYFDNYLNSEVVNLRVSVLNQIIRLPSLAQGYIPLLAPKNCTVTIEASRPGSPPDQPMQIIFLNIPMPAFIWGPDDF